MAIDMYLHIYEDGEPGEDGKPTQRVTVSEILAWSWGCSNSQNRCRVKEKREYDTRPMKWTNEQVSLWLEKNDFKQFVELFKTNEVDGEVLMHLGDSGLKELDIKPIGTRLKLLRRISDLSLEDSRMESDLDEQKSKSNLQDVSMTGWMDSNVIKAHMMSTLSGKPVKRAVLVCYKGPERHRRSRYGGDDEEEEEKKIEVPAGTPFLAIEMLGCVFTSVSTGGSGGEDRFTTNSSLNFESIKFHHYGASETQNLDLLYRSMGLSELEIFKIQNSRKTLPPLESVAPGVSVMYDSTVGDECKRSEWGAFTKNKPTPMKEWPYPSPTVLEAAKKKAEEEKKKKEEEKKKKEEAKAKKEVKL